MSVKTICNKDCFDGKFYKKGEKRSFPDEKAAEQQPYFTVISKKEKAKRSRKPTEEKTEE